MKKVLVVGSMSTLVNIQSQFGILSLSDTDVGKEEIELFKLKAPIAFENYDEVETDKMFKEEGGIYQSFINCRAEFSTICIGERYGADNYYDLDTMDMFIDNTGESMRVYNKKTYSPEDFKNIIREMSIHLEKQLSRVIHVTTILPF